LTMANPASMITDRFRLSLGFRATLPAGAGLLPRLFGPGAAFESRAFVSMPIMLDHMVR